MKPLKLLLVVIFFLIALSNANAQTLKISAQNMMIKSSDSISFEYWLTNQTTEPISYLYGSYNANFRKSVLGGAPSATMRILASGLPAGYVPRTPTVYFKPGEDSCQLRTTANLSPGIGNGYIIPVGASVMICRLSLRLPTGYNFCVYLEDLLDWRTRLFAAPKTTIYFDNNGVISEYTNVSYYGGLYGPPFGYYLPLQVKATNYLIHSSDSITFDISLNNPICGYSISYLYGKYYANIRKIFVNGAPDTNVNFRIIGYGIPGIYCPINPSIFYTSDSIQLRLDANPSPGIGNGFIIPAGMNTLLIRCSLRLTGGYQFAFNYLKYKWREGTFALPITKIFNDDKGVEGEYTNVSYISEFPTYSSPVIWQVQIKSLINSVFDNDNFAGVNDIATDGYDSEYDILEAALPQGNYISTYFYHPEWGVVNGSKFTCDINYNLNLTDTVKRWIFYVKTNILNDTAKLSFLNDSIPTNYALYLKDSISGQTINLREVTNYVYYNVSLSPRAFYILVGDETNILIPPAPVLASPINNTTGLYQPVTLVWNKNYFSHKFKLQVSLDSSFGSYIINDSNLTDSFKVIPTLLYFTNYYWRVSAGNDAGYGNFSEVWKFKTMGFPNPVPLIYPEQNSVNIPTTLSFIWNKPTDQTIKSTSNKIIINKYWFELSTDSLFTDAIKDTSLTDTTKSMTGLTNFTTYYWRVKAKNEAGWGDFGSKWNFTTIVPIPQAPLLTTPANDTTDLSLTPILVWDTVSYASGYVVIVSSDSLFSSFTDSAAVTTNQYAVPNGKLNPFTKYYWKVAAFNISGIGQWSTIWNFRTLQNLTLNLKVYLEGFWNGVSQIPDTINVYLANDRYGTPPYKIVDSCEVLLSTNGTGTLNFTKCPNYNYHIVVFHRNHLETWSRLPQSFVKDIPVNFNFTTTITQAYGSNMIFSNGAWCIFGGDINWDGFIDGADMAPLDNDLYNYVSGYVITDLNGDQFVDGSDMAILDNNLYNYIGVVRPSGKDWEKIILKSKQEQSKTILNTKVKSNRNK